MRTQISSNVSQETLRQAKELVDKRGYSMRDVVTVAIRDLYLKEISMATFEKGLKVHYRCGHDFPFPDNFEERTKQTIEGAQQFGKLTSCPLCMKEKEFSEKAAQESWQ